MADASGTREEARSRLARALDVPSAFPWQLDLLDRMLAGALPSAVDVPTGLGKTAVIAVWLVARAAGAHVARRLVYVVDRRAVVDQATAVAEALRNFVARDPALRAALGLEGQRSLAISTLRGQFIDNREWLSDPSAPAIVVGTVDMVGSRLLFEGYGVSRRMRPYHAGLLGADSLIVLDEAHLVPAFEHLVRTIAHAAENGLGARDPVLNDLVPRLRLLPLSATGRSTANAITLSNADHAHPGVARRLAATKELVFRPGVPPKKLPEWLAEEAWTLTANGTRPTRCIVFCDRRSDAQAVAEHLAKRAGQTASLDEEIELLVGGRRVWERAEAASWLSVRGLLAGTQRAVEKPAFVIATSAGEVGIDLDAEHMVSDLVAWERMVQRLGRVNRRGDGAAQVVIVPAAEEDDTEEDDTIVRRLAAVRELLQELPRTIGGAFDASPGALAKLKDRTETDERIRGLIARGSTPEPLYPPLTRPLLEAWSMTSLENHTGRPQVEPWLRGWIQDEEPQTTIVWRELLPVTHDGRHLLSSLDLDAYFAAAGPHLAEQLETETWRASAWLIKRTHSLKLNATAATGRPDQSAMPAESVEIVKEANPASDVSAQDQSIHEAQIVGVVIADSREPWPLSVRDLLDKGKRAEIEGRFAGATVLVDVRLGGLNRGLLDDHSGDATDLTTLRSPSGDPVLPIRIRRTRGQGEENVSDEGWRQEARIAIDYSSEGDEIEWLVIESLVAEPAESEEGRAIGPRRAQKLDEHEEWTEQAACRLAKRLGLQSRYADVLALAARLHDEGKRAKRWQQAFRAPSDAIYAKTTSRPNIHLLAGYRHEMGSLPHAERDDRVQALDEDLRDLCLHLIAAHHGYARPLLRTDGGEEPPSKLETRAQEIALRFARLEKRWGPWGLAWWEALLRAADQQASRKNDEVGADG